MTAEGRMTHQTRVLVVDDERFFREAIREILAEEQLECVEVEDGEQALSQALDPHIGVVVLDIRLPGIDGIEVLRRLREIRPALRVIMLSASTDQELVLEALRLGACDYLAKPLHDEELVLGVRRALESYEVATDWGLLRGRLDRLVLGVETLAERARHVEGEERTELLQVGAAETAAHVLEAAKTSLMLLNEEGTELRVAAAVGREIGAGEMDPVAVGEGVAGMALERSEALVVNDVRDDERFAERPGSGRYRSASFAVAPLSSGDQRLGVICATDREDGRDFGEQDVALMRLLAMQISQLMAVGRSETPEPKPLEGDPDSTQVDGPSVRFPVESEGDVDFDAELARLVCDAVVSELEPGRVIQAALEPLASGLPADPVSLFLIGGPSAELRCEGAWEGGTRSERDVIPRTGGLTGTVLQTGHLVATENPAQDPRFDSDVDTPADGVAGPMMCIPLRFRGKVVGLARAFLTEEGRASARTGEVLASALSAAVRSVLLYRSLVESIEEVAEARKQSRRPH